MYTVTNLINGCGHTSYKDYLDTKYVVNYGQIAGFKTILSFWMIPIVFLDISLISIDTTVML